MIRRNDSEKKLLAVCITIMVIICHAVYGESLVPPPYRHSYGITKATPKHLFMFVGPRTFFDDPQGLATAKMTARDDTTKEGDDDEVVVYGVNSGRHEIIYNTSMWGIAIYGKKGSGEGEFNTPKGVACDPEGNVYVVDSGNNRLVHLFNPLKRVEWVKTIGDSILSKPEQVGLDEAGLIYVSDAGNNRIVVFDENGKVKRYIDPGFVEGPEALAVADGRNQWSYFDEEKAIFCADKNGTRIWKLNLDGSVVVKRDLKKDHKACYAATDYYHNLWVTIKDKHKILKYDHDLNFLDAYGSKGKEKGQFIEPRGIAIWKRYGQTFVAEEKGAQYFWIGTDIQSYNIHPHEGKRTDYLIETELTEYSYVSLMSIAGSDTTFLMKRRMVHPGPRKTPFYSKGIKGDILLRIEPTYSSYTYRNWDYQLKIPQ